MAVGERAKHGTADRPDSETHREDGEYRKQVCRLVVRREEFSGEDRREDRVDQPVRPLHDGPKCRGEYRLLLSSRQDGLPCGLPWGVYGRAFCDTVVNR